MSSVLRLPFDQYQRYRLVTDLLARVRQGGERLKVLDVGGRTALLRQFLPDDDVILVDLEPSDIRKGIVLGSGSELPFQAESFDVVCAFDTLEHVPPDDREAFVRECWRVTRAYTILAGPYDAPKVRRAENLLRRFMREKLRIKHRYLEEHREHGLPVQLEVEQQITGLGGVHCSVGHANVERWLGIMSMGMYLDNDPGLRRMAASVYEFYNRNMYKSDHAEPTYRQAIVGAFNGAPLPVLDDMFDPPVPPRGAVEGLNELLASMVAFDQERTAWREEKAKYESSVDTLAKDLEGHRQTLGVVGADAEARKETSKTLKADLAEHKRVLKELKKENNALQREMNRREKLRTAELKELKKVKQELQGTHASATYQAEVADTEKSMRGALEGDLKEHRVVLKQLKEDLVAMTAERDKLTGELATARRHADEIGQQLGVSQKESAEAISVLEVDLAEHRKVMIGAQKEVKALEVTVKELTAEVEGYRDQTPKLQTELDARGEELERLREELGKHSTHTPSLEQELKARGEEIERLGVELEKYRAHTPEVEGSLAEVRAHAETMAGELERVRSEAQQSVRTIQADLDGHKKMLTALKNALEARSAEQQKLEKLLAAERQEGALHAMNLQGEIDRLRHQLGEGAGEEGGSGGSTGSDALPDSEVEGHRLALEEALREKRGVEDRLGSASAELQAREQRLGSLERDLERQKKLVLELRRHETEQGKLIEELSTDLDGHRKTVEQLLEELRQARGEAESA